MVVESRSDFHMAMVGQHTAGADSMTTSTCRREGQNSPRIYLRLRSGKSADCLRPETTRRSSVVTANVSVAGNLRPFSDVALADPPPYPRRPCRARACHLTSESYGADARHSYTMQTRQEASTKQGQISGGTILQKATTEHEVENSAQVLEKNERTQAALDPWHKSESEVLELSMQRTMDKKRYLWSCGAFK